MEGILVAVQLVIFHSVDGHEVAVNPRHVTSMLAAKDDVKNKLFVDSVRCIIQMTDGKLITVAESCDTVKQRLEEAR